MVTERTFAAFLFDMDGTLLDSIASAHRVWTQWAERHGLEPAPVLTMMPGVRAIETVRRLAIPGVDAEAEAAWLAQAEIDDIEGVVAIGGADAFLKTLPSDRWAIVTSAPRALAEVRLRAAGLPTPPVLIAAEDIEQGKPAPDPFLRAAEALGVPVTECLVWEDAASGIAAAEAAGASVAVMTAAHLRPFETSHPRFGDYGRLRVEAVAGGLILMEETA